MKLQNNRGQVMLIACLLFLAAAAAVSAAAAGPALRRVSAARAFADARQGLYAVASVSEDVAYRKIKGLAVGNAEIFSVGGISATAEVANVSGGQEISAFANGTRFSRNTTMRLVAGDGASFYYGMQASAGGIDLLNTASIAGNVYSNGPVTGENSNLVKGIVVSAGSFGFIDGVHATGTVYAHTIRDSDIDGDAYYQTISGTTVGGALHPGSADQATSSLAISDEQIAEWESDAAAGGTISSPCPYKITDTATLGPKKIACDMEISGNGYALTLNGPLWIVGNLTISNGPTIKVASSLGGASVPIIADKPSNQTTSSKIELQNSAVFQGSGSTDSYVLMISHNKSAKQGGSETAIDLKNSIDGDLLVYAPHGEVLIQDSVNVKEASGYRIRLKNSAEVIYETGLANLIFTSGPSGGYMIESWKETE
ncbi:MAG: hypothetical protein A3C08_02395 [Candidatus Taylorbacteria bacterium RIFCSPHIGHO2_02_FULL_47_18]|uniref:Uncharacterized protein n=1 Tax=Candidatus Taylorbacteria bacterium RIFCSPLOWO2_01_FULL_48_100 TaxID=1802322 RepID=A0A1G2NI36_9BACT|nr:MAG: hypothetical protein A3C08_02395 [Candidatus Taylorbacteria bacterium RIFCSPHIGHO2_02_FULL_47_18]OHA35002.1 MAG: hypothetical protein A2938_01380 [Candidatus Taylorbacteria bacterium RIFCSPLOWO2_01_FULL_48_100]OHA44700.1 MAG: hypothetical protein A3H13_03125 [Candidatus Taylorbacteria bacterium RIFCSPLOWO2_12_FULL_48_11]